MPTPAPRTPERLRVVSQLSVLIWLPVAFLVFTLARAFFVVGAVNLTVKISAGLFGLVVTGIYVWLTWVTYNWLNALVQNTTRISLARSADILRAWLILSMVATTLAAAIVLLGFFFASSHRVSSSGVSIFKIALQLAGYVVWFIAAGLIRTWLDVGYAPGFRKERPRLVAALWVTILLALVQTVTGLFSSVSKDVWNTAFAVIAFAFSAYTLILQIRLTNLTFGVEKEQADVIQTM